jgi:hypothetical protein
VERESLKIQQQKKLWKEKPRTIQIGTIFVTIVDICWSTKNTCESISREIVYKIILIADFLWKMCGSGDPRRRRGGCDWIENLRSSVTTIQYLIQKLQEVNVKKVKHQNLKS